MMRPGWYSWVAVILGCLTSMAISVGVSVQASDRALERDQAARAEEQQRRERDLRAQQDRAREATCAIIVKMAAANQRQADVFPPNQEVADAWAEMSEVFQCT